MNPLEFADKYLYPFKTKGNEIVPLYCPSCGGGSKRDKYTFALNMDKLTYNCKRGKCGVSGAFFQLCKEYGEEADNTEDWKRNYVPHKKVYKKPNVHAKKPNNQVKEYFAKRGISEETYKARKVGQNEQGAIMFPYFDDGELVLVKYRTFDKKMWRTTDSKGVFWGLDDITDFNTLIITEGEIDALTLDECGIKNVVSVPSGSNDLECINHGWDKLEKFKEIVIWNDQDDAGIEMRDELIKRLGEDRCKYIESKHKDPNEQLLSEGVESILKTLKDARHTPPKNVLRVSEVQEYDPSKIKTIKSGIFGIDKITGGFQLGHVTIVSGKRGSGKSTILNTFIAEAIQQGYGSWVFSGELPASLFRYWCERTIVGKNNLTRKHNEDTPDTYYLEQETKDLVRSWYKDKFFIYDNTKETKTNFILKSMESSYKRYGCRFFVIDNIMMLNFGNGSEKEKLDKQSQFVDACVKLSQKYDLHIIIVQHPVKIFERMSIDHIKGSGDITNRASLTFLVHRLTEQEKQESQYSSALEIAKNRINGRMLEVDLHFDEASKRFFGDSDDIDKNYGWGCPF